LSWTGVFGRAYRIERSLDLSQPNWQPIGAVGGVSYGPTVFTDPEAAGFPQAFYRLLPSL
jgi:hypothetical protein